MGVRRLIPVLMVAMSGAFVLPVRAAHAEPATCQRVAVIGGSITLGAVTSQSQELVELGMTDLRIDAKVSRRIKSKNGGISVLKSMRAKGYSPDCIVVALGNNDMPSRVIASIYDGLIHAMMDEIGPAPRVLWINLYRKPFRTHDAGFNAALVRAAAVYPNLAIGDWETRVLANRTWLTRDGIHLTSTGGRERSKWIAALVHTHLQGGGPAGPPPASCVIATVPLKRLTKHADVRCLEQRLRQLRWFTATPNTTFDTATKNALTAWQKRHGLAATGVLDATTRAALGVG